jgi:hypothetical protein
MSESPAARRAALAQLLLAGACVLLLPLGIRAANRLNRAPTLAPTYLPALEGPRERHAFEAVRVSDLARMNPAFVIIGDSMAGSRIDPDLLGQLTGRLIAPLEFAGSGPAFWYLALKNWVIASGIHPRCVFVFFRDTNLTDVLFRIDSFWSRDTAAHDREEELNAIVARRRGTAFYRVRSGFDRLYRAADARQWLEPVVDGWPARVLVPYRRQRTAFLNAVNDRFELAHLRPMDAADMQAAEDRDADFDGLLDKSVLPLMLRDAHQAGLTISFIRVQRRPVNGALPYQSPALLRYLGKLRRYLEANGALYRDDYGDPNETLDMYKDGDHLTLEGRRRYTEAFAARLRQRFP